MKYFIFVLALLFFPPFIYRYYQQLLVKKKCQTNGYILLTYDDGPSIEMTQELLDVLELTQTKATFFILGNKIAGNEAIIQRMINSGHVIGCHGYQHLNAWKTLPWIGVQNISQGIEALSKIQINCKFFRPPYGKITTITLGMIIAKKLKTIWWTFVSGDTYKILPDPNKFSEKVIREGGGIVLMHDFHKSKLRKDFVLEVTSLIIEKSKQNGLLLKTLGEIL